MLKEAIKYLISLGDTQTLQFNGDSYTNREIFRVEEPLCKMLKTTTLTSLVDYIKSNIDSKSENLLIHITGPEQVILEGELNKDRKREVYLVAEALTPNNIYFDTFLDSEKFNIMMQSSFVSSKDKEIILKVAGNIQDDAVQKYGDDGVSQQVTIKSGVASVANVVVPNPVELAPFRSFPEIEQVQSKFIFRMKEGARCALFEADGGAWRNIAMQRIKEFLEIELKDYKEINIIS